MEQFTGDYSYTTFENYDSLGEVIMIKVKYLAVGDQGRLRWRFQCIIQDTEIEGSKSYETKEEALIAGELWVKKLGLKNE